MSPPPWTRQRAAGFYRRPSSQPGPVTDAPADRQRRRSSRSAVTTSRRPGSVAASAAIASSPGPEASTHPQPRRRVEGGAPGGAFDDQHEVRQPPVQRRQVRHVRQAGQAAFGQGGHLVVQAQRGGGAIAPPAVGPRAHHVRRIHDDRHRRESLRQQRPVLGEAGMQPQRRHVGGADPPRLGDLRAGRAHREQRGGRADVGPVRPAAVVVEQHALDVHPAGRQAALLRRLAQRRGDGRLVAVPGAARRPPGAAVLTPPAAPGEQHPGAVRPGARPPADVAEQADRAEPSPVQMPSVAAGPAISVLPGHAGDDSGPPRAPQPRRTAAVS